MPTLLHIHWKNILDYHKDDNFDSLQAYLMTEPQLVHLYAIQVWYNPSKESSTTYVLFKPYLTEG